MKRDRDRDEDHTHRSTFDDLDFHDPYFNDLDHDNTGYGIIGCKTSSLKMSQLALLM